MSSAVKAMVAGIVMASAMGADAAAAASATGQWVVADGSSRISIQSCGAALCGTVLTSSTAAHRGMTILRQMKPAGDDRWVGTILDPRTGSIYHSKMTLEGNRLRVQGCVAGGLICGGQSWTRAQ
jgi:uncharacterized protein (DUF2147 family)